MIVWLMNKSSFGTLPLGSRAIWHSFDPGEFRVALCHNYPTMEGEPQRPEHSRFQKILNELQTSVLNRLLGLAPKTPQSEFTSEHFREVVQTIRKIDMAMSSLKDRRKDKSFSRLPDNFAVELADIPKTGRVITSTWVGRGDQIAPKAPDNMPELTASKDVLADFEKGADKIVLPPDVLQLLQEKDTYFVLMIPETGHNVREGKLDLEYDDYDCCIGTMVDGRLLYVPALMNFYYNKETIPAGIPFNSAGFAAKDEEERYVIWESNAFRRVPPQSTTFPMEFNDGMKPPSYKAFYDFASRLTTLYVVRIGTPSKQKSEVTEAAHQSLGSMVPQPMNI